jgi:hypothetical protein
VGYELHRAPLVLAESRAKRGGESCGNSVLERMRMHFQILLQQSLSYCRYKGLTLPLCCAYAEGVGKRVKLFRGDLLQADLQEATVVFLFLLPQGMIL